MREMINKIRVIKDKHNLNIKFHKGIGSDTYRAEIYTKDGSFITSFSGKISDQEEVVKKALDFLEKKFPKEQGGN